MLIFRASQPTLPQSFSWRCESVGRKAGYSDNEAYRPTGAPELDLLAAIVRRAVRDAHRGDVEAVEWLDAYCPQWRRYV